MWFTARAQPRIIEAERGNTVNSQNKLMELRLRRGLTQQAVAEQLDVSRQAISRWETGSAAPTRDKMQAIARLYDVPLSYLYDDDAVLPDENTKKETEVAQAASKQQICTIWLLSCIVVCLLLLSVFLACRLFQEKRRTAEDTSISFDALPVSELDDGDIFEFDTIGFDE